VDAYEDILWGGGESPVSQEQPAVLRHPPVRLPHDCDWEPFVGDLFAKAPFANDPFSTDPFATDPFANDPFSTDPFSDPFSKEPAANKPFSQEPFAADPGCDQPPADAPRFDESCFEEPLDRERFGGQPADPDFAAGHAGEAGETPGAEPSSTLPRREARPPARILYLEADPAADREQMAAVRELLEAAGYRLLCGHPDDFDCIDLARGADLLLVDLPPAAGSARDLLCPFWTDPAAAAVPVVFITGNPRAPAHAVSVGGSDHLARPVAPPLLLATVAARLASQRALRRLFAPAG
jgi:CheY-like chemotaxis protein